MLPILTHIGAIPIKTYSVLLTLAILTGLVGLGWRGWHVDERPDAWIDAGLVAVIAGVIGGRVGHVALHWGYFSERIGESVQVWRGGLDWHGALLAGILGLLLACHLFDVDWRAATDVLAWVLPVAMLLAYTGCLMSRCAYGREVWTLADYPLLVAAELPDIYGIVAPRLSSQVYGIAAGVLLLALIWLSSRLIVRSGVRFWLALLLVSLTAFGIAFTQGDAVPMVGALRLDQLFSLALAGLGGIAAVAAALTGQNSISDRVTRPK